MTNKNDLAIAEQVLALFVSVGVAPRRTEEERIWAELGAADTPDHAALAKRFRRIARAPNLFDRAVCDGEVRQTFDRKVRRRWAASWRRKTGCDVPSIDRIDWYSLSREQQAHVRLMARELMAYHASFVRRGAPRKHILDTLLLGLADIFIDRDGLAGGVSDLSDTKTGPFIEFCKAHLATIPDAGKDPAISVVTADALSSRWHRLTKAMRTDPPPLVAVPKGARRTGKRAPLL